MTQCIAEIRVSVTYPGGEGQSLVIPLPEETAWKILAAMGDSRDDLLHELMMAADRYLPVSDYRPGADPD
jgi:hypothetical protein